MRQKQLLVIIVSLIAAWIFQTLHIPLAWMLGPLAVTLIFNAIGVTLRVPASFRDGALLVIGYTIGASYTVEAGYIILHQLPFMLLMTLLLFGYGLLAAWLLMRWTGINAPTAIIGTVPGGLTQMVLLSEEIPKSDMTTVALLQTVRLLAILFIAPFVAVHGFANPQAGDASMLPSAGASLWRFANGPWYMYLFFISIGAGVAWLASKVKFPTAYLLGPVFAAAVLISFGFTAPSEPAIFIMAAQFVLGVYLGQSMQLSNMKGWSKLLPGAIISTIGIIAFSFGLALLTAAVHPISMVTAFLSAIPGGIAEMALTGANVHADLAIITSYQLFRILFILFVVPPLIRRMLLRD